MSAAQPANRGWRSRPQPVLDREDSLPSDGSGHDQRHLNIGDGAVVAIEPLKDLQEGASTGLLRGTELGQHKGRSDRVLVSDFSCKQEPVTLLGPNEHVLDAPRDRPGAPLRLKIPHDASDVLASHEKVVDDLPTRRSHHTGEELGGDLRLDPNLARGLTFEASESDQRGQLVASHKTIAAGLPRIGNHGSDPVSIRVRAHDQVGPELTSQLDRLLKSREVFWVWCTKTNIWKQAIM